jgi:ribosomal protein S24E
MAKHQAVFDNIKRLATLPACLTTIDLASMPENEIFVTTNASDFGSGAMLSFGKTYEKARSFKGAELNYPVHKKELLVIIRALAKW